MTLYYTAADIDQLSASGIRRIELGDGVKMTDYARELAMELGIELILPGSPPPNMAQTADATRTGSRWNKPRGCQWNENPAA